MIALPLIDLCVSSRALGGEYLDRDGEVMTWATVLDACPLGLERKYHARCACCQVRKIGETWTGSVCATACTFPLTKSGRPIASPDGLAGWIRRQAET